MNWSIRSGSASVLIVLGVALWCAEAAQAQCAPVTLSGALTASDPTQVDRLVRDAIPSTCAAPKACPGVVAAGNPHYDAYSLTNQSGAPQCVSVTLTTSCTSIFMAAYLGTFNQANLCDNYLADPGSSPPPSATMSFTVPAGATFVLVVSEVTANAGCPAYTLLVEGEICCPPVTFNGALTAADPTQTDQLVQDAVPSTCAAPKVCPGTVPVGSRPYDAYTLTNQSGAPQCVSVTVTADCGGDNPIFVVAYLTTFNPANICANYLADIGSSPFFGSATMSFTVPAGATFVVVVSDVNPTNCPAYELVVTGDLCAPPPAPGPGRVSDTKKGSVLMYSKVELRYTAAGVLIQDTFIDIANDFPADVLVKMYFINGDPRIVVAGVVVEPGWNWVNNVITLTANEPTYWSAATGLPKGVSPFTVLDPGALPGRVDPEVPTERMLRGFIIAFAVNAAGCEIRWNHLKGDACIVRYDQNSAWEYNAWSFAAVDAAVGNGDPTGTCGTLLFNGVEFALAFDQLLMDFYAVGSAAFSTAGSLVTISTDLTLHPVTADLRQETNGPVQTKASFDIWNMNEVKFSGTDRCITCWNQALLSSYGLPNHFFLVNLQTDKGRARIDGLASSVVCPAISGVAPASTLDPLLGVVAKHLTFNGVAAAVAGTTLHGVGTQADGFVRFDPPTGGGGPPENTGSMWLDTISREINGALSPRSQR